MGPRYKVELWSHSHGRHARHRQEPEMNHGKDAKDVAKLFCKLLTSRNEPR